MSSSVTAYDFLIIGAGIIGVSIARELRRVHGGRVMVIEKESKPGLHASGRNSGVLHAGVYYKADTLKAKFCVEGNRWMRSYCRQKDLPINEYGKVIVAKHERELSVLHDLYKRARENGANVSWLDPQELKEVEPCARTVEQAVYVKDTAVVNPQEMMKSLVQDAIEDGVQFEFGCHFRQRGVEQEIITSQGPMMYGHLVNSAGLFADKIAHLFGVGSQYQILPFRGHYFQLKSSSRFHVRGNIYPVPDLRNPFLGVHFTRRPDGEVTVGPSALPLLGREQYGGWSGANMADGLTMVRYLSMLFSTNLNHFRSLAWQELRKLSRQGFFREAEGLGVGLQPGDLLPGKCPGIRAQLLDTKNAKLVEDFVVERRPNSTHILNAVSPAFTSSYPFSKFVVERMSL